MTRAEYVYRDKYFPVPNFIFEITSYMFIRRRDKIRKYWAVQKVFCMKRTFQCHYALREEFSKEYHR